MASGAAVLADGTTMQRILTNNRDLIGVEMETYAIFAAAVEASNSGCKASINLEFQDRSNRQHFVYLRSDLLDKYLKDNKLKIVHAIWGEREIAFKTREEQDKFYDENSAKEFKVFQKIVEY